MRVEPGRRQRCPDEGLRINRRSWLRLLVASAAAIALPALAAGPSAIANPRDIVVEIYRISAGKDGKYRGPSAFSDKGVRRESVLSEA